MQGNNIAFSPLDMSRFRRRGPRPNKYKPRPTKVRNPKIAAHIMTMHDAWKSAFDARPVVRNKEPSGNSVTSVKLFMHVHRAVARRAIADFLNKQKS